MLKLMKLDVIVFTYRLSRFSDDILESSDLFEVVEALLDAKDKAYELGLTLQLPPVEVKSICSHRKDPQDRLTGIIEYALKQVKPKPTWRGIVTALRSPIVDEPVLAARVELDKIPPSSLAGSVDRETEDSDVRRRVGVVEEEGNAELRIYPCIDFYNVIVIHTSSVANCSGT